MKKLLIVLMLVFIALPAYAVIKQSGTGPIVESEHAVVYMLNGKATTGDSAVFTIYPGSRTFDAKIVGTGAVTATVIIYVSNTGADNDWIAATTSPHIDLSGTTSDADGFAMNAKWAYVKANISAISGTSAAVTVTMGV